MKITEMSVSLKPSSSRAVGWVLHDDSILFMPIGETVSSNSTKTHTNVATDGEHFWIRINNVTAIKYNGSNCTVVRSGNYFMVTIPNNYDPSIPFTCS